MLTGAAAAMLAACGSSASSASSSASSARSSASSAQRTRLTNELSAQLKAAGVPSNLASCVTRQSGGLSLASVRELVLAGSSPPTATGRVGNHLFATCVAQGAGVASLRAMMTQSMRRSMPSGTPTALTTCIEQKANAISPSKLALLLFPPSATQPASAQARGRQFGVGLAEQCVREPAVRPALLGLVLRPVQRGLNGGHYSTAFKSCVLGKLRKIRSSALARAVTHPAGAYSFGVQLGRNAAEACIASGAKP